jgi:hypothetical protein
VEAVEGATWRGVVVVVGGRKGRCVAVALALAVVVAVLVGIR